MTRRELLLLAGASPMRAQVLSLSESLNQTSPLQSIETSITPADLFFVRDHFKEPEIALPGWRLKIEGRVARPLELSLADILEESTKKLEAVLECAGNPTGGAVANAVWEGMPFADALDKAGAAHDALAVLLEGADTGRLTEHAPEQPYCQLVPIEKCMRPESLIAFKLNGRFLPRKNGFPARALFPGWYGMDSVKWLRRIVVLGPEDQAPSFSSSGMDKFYNRIVKSPAGGLQITRLNEIQVRSVIAWPEDNARLPGGAYIVRGFAWTGTGLVRNVNFSADAGRTWSRAHFESQPRPFSWVRWNCPWSAGRGDHVLMSRAIDQSGREQPLDRDASRKDGYELNFCARVRCSVR